MRWVLIILVLPINILCQQYDPQIQKHIKPDFHKLSELLTSNGGCKFLNKDSTSFTGTAYKIEYISDYYFLSNNSEQDTITCRIKIIPFKMVTEMVFLKLLILTFIQKVVFQMNL